MKSQTNNNLVYAVGALLVLLVLSGLIFLNSYFVALKISLTLGYDYTIAEGIDFANGQQVTSKILNNKTIVWTKYEKTSDFSPVLTKYQLHHDKPLVEYKSGEFYIKNPFICLLAPEHVDWKHLDLKEWRWYFFKNIPVNSYNTQFFEFSGSMYFNYLKNNNLPIEEVQESYKEFARIFNDEQKRSIFSRNFIDTHEKPFIMALVANAAKTGTLPADLNWDDIARIIMKYRDDFPDNLPEAVMGILSITDFWHYDFQEETFFMLNNYLLRPTEYNALHVFLYIIKLVQEENESFSLSETGNLATETEVEEQTIEHRKENRVADFDNVFDILHKHNLLEKCLSQVYSDDVETPPLPAPAAIPPDYSGYRLINIYYTDTYDDLPEREKLLKISCFPEIFKTYWQERLKKLQEKQKEK